MSDKIINVFSSAAVPYAAFNLRDPYYWQMSEKVARAAHARSGRTIGVAVDLGAGIGISTMVLRRFADHVIAIEPEEDMRHICSLNVMGDPRVTVLEGRAETLTEVLERAAISRVDAVCASQMAHVLNPPNTKSLIPQVARQIRDVLFAGGVFAFDLGPSNYAFATKLADHRSGTFNVGEIRTEFSHPIYQRAERILRRITKEEFPSFESENLWPPPAARMSFEFLEAACTEGGLYDLEVSEELVLLSGERIVEFVRNGWAVFFRWGDLAKLPVERKLALVGRMMNELCSAGDFESMKRVEAYHPTAVFTAVTAD